MFLTHPLPQTPFQSSGLDTSRTTRHHGLVDRVYRERGRLGSPHRRPLSVDKHGRQISFLQRMCGIGRGQGVGTHCCLWTPDQGDLGKASTQDVGARTGVERRVKESDPKPQRTGTQGAIGNAAFKGCRKWGVARRQHGHDSDSTHKSGLCCLEGGHLPGPPF